MSLSVIFKLSVKRAFLVSFRDCAFFVEILFAFAKRKFDFYKTSRKVKRNGNKGITFFVDFADYFIDFEAVH